MENDNLQNRLLMLKEFRYVHIELLNEKYRYRGTIIHVGKDYIEFADSEIFTVRFFRISEVKSITIKRQIKNRKGLIDKDKDSISNTERLEECIIRYLRIASKGTKGKLVIDELKTMGELAELEKEEIEESGN